MTAGDLAPLKETLAAIGLRADKRFGQHFLFDLNLTRKIVRLAGVQAGAVVLEVGPGPGGLTRALLEAGARVLAVERDPRFVPVLDELAEAFPEHLIVAQADALALGEAETLLGTGWGEDAAIVANLPYNVGTPLLVKWLTGPWRPTSMTLMFQKEVARRIVGPAGSSDYGRLSVLAQATCVVEGVLDIPARAFTPAPKVDSAVVRIVPRADAPDPRRLAALQAVTGAAFGQRRKMLRASLRALGGEALCRRAGIAPDARAEVLTVAQFLDLAQSWLEDQPPSSSPATKG